MTMGSTTTFVYDYLGRRLSKTSAGSATRYPLANYEIGPDGVITKYLGDVAKKSNGQIFYYHRDHLGSVHAITSSSGARVQLVEYDPWGRVSRQEGTVDVSHRFTDQELDAETGLYYFDHRYYDPVLGRFVSPDPFVPFPTNPQSFNRYSYVMNNPVNRIDWNGFDDGDADSSGDSPGEPGDEATPADPGPPATDLVALTDDMQNVPFNIRIEIRLNEVVRPDPPPSPPPSLAPPATPGPSGGSGPADDPGSPRLAMQYQGEGGHGFGVMPADPRAMSDAVKALGTAIGAAIGGAIGLSSQGQNGGQGGAAGPAGDAANANPAQSVAGQSTPATPSPPSMPGADPGKGKSNSDKGDRISQINDNFPKPGEFARALGRSARSNPLSQEEANRAITIANTRGISVRANPSDLAGHTRGSQLGPHIHIGEVHVRVQPGVGF